MGNTTTNRLKKPNPKIIAEPEEHEQDSSMSITNYSNNSNSLDGFSILSQKFISTSDIALFSWDRLQSIYYEVIRKTSDSTELEPYVVMVLNDLFQAIISNNIFQMSRELNSSILDTDGGHQNYFEECTGRNLKSHTKSLNSKDKIRNHIFSIIYLHMKILNHMSNENYDEVHSILQLIGISHALMKVDPNYFKTMDVAMGKFLIGNKLLTESNAECSVIYFNYVTSYIINCMDLQQSHDNFGTDHITDDQHSTIVRENYRNMKKWYKLVKSIQEEIIELKEPETFATETIEETSSALSTVPTEILAQDACIMKYFIKKKDTTNEVK